MDLAGRVALVTGGSGDLGAAICGALARSKVNVAVAYVAEKERAERVAAEVEGAGCRAWTVQLDQSSASAPDEVVATYSLVLSDGYSFVGTVTNGLSVL